MSDFLPDNDPYAQAAAEQREADADWADQVDHWRREREDALTRDAGERPGDQRGWPVHIERVRHAGYSDGDPKGVVIP